MKYKMGCTMCECVRTYVFFILISVSPYMCYGHIFIIAPLPLEASVCIDNFDSRVFYILFSCSVDKSVQVQFVVRRQTDRQIDF